MPVRFFAFPSTRARDRPTGLAVGRRPAESSTGRVRASSRPCPPAARAVRRARVPRRVVATCSDHRVRAPALPPTYDERENLEPSCVRRRVARADDRVLVIDATARRPGKIATAGGLLPFVGVCTASEGGARSCLHRGLQARLAAGAQLVLELDCEFSHDPRSPRLILARRPGRRLGSRTCAACGCVGGLLRRAISMRRSTRDPADAVKDARALQVLPSRGAGDRPRRDRGARLHFPDRETFRAA